MDSPAALTYVPNDPGVRCPVSGCLVPPPSHAPSLATASPGVQFGGVARPKEGAKDVTGPGRAAGYHLGYRVLRHWPSGFAAMITLPPGLGPGEWSLQFAFSSARVEGVWGASWRPSGNGDSGTATGPWQWHGNNGGSGGLQDRQMMVTAAGAPAVPSECVLNGISCQFGR